jgi:glutathione S-transferase
MKLYYSPGACSLAPHIVLREAGVTFSLDRVDTQAGKTQSGASYSEINPKGTVPCLDIGNGQRLTEGPVIAQYIADTAKNTSLLPAAGTLARYRVLEWQNYITSELHKSFSPLFGRPSVEADAKELFKQSLTKKLNWVSQQLDRSEYLTGSSFTVADAYLFVVAGWSKHVNVSLEKADSLRGFLERVASRPFVKEALAQER